MYFCRICGNVTHFIEHNLIETQIHFDGQSGEVAGSCDSFLECDEVICGVCKATANDGNIVNRKTGERL